jgi:hypothetical protein
MDSTQYTIGRNILNDGSLGLEPPVSAQEVLDTLQTK